MTELGPEDWRALANCHGTHPNLFFPERGQTRQLRMAQAVCAECVVTEECLQFALDNHIMHGVWGGRSERQRRQMRRERRAS